MEFNKLTPEEERVIVHKGTERPFTGEYNNNKQSGTYIFLSKNQQPKKDRTYFHDEKQFTDPLPFFLHAASLDQACSTIVEYSRLYRHQSTLIFIYF